MVRIYMARALLEHGTYSIGERFAFPGGAPRDLGPIYNEWGYVNDKALVCTDPHRSPPSCPGKLYAAKAPGPSFLAVPVLAAMQRLEAPLALKWLDVFVLRWVLCIVPSAIFWVAMRRFVLAAGAPAEASLGCILAGALGSLSFTYGQMFAGHQLAALRVTAQRPRELEKHCLSGEAATQRAAETVDMDVAGEFVFDSPEHYTATISARSFAMGRLMQSVRTSIEGQRVGECH